MEWVPFGDLPGKEIKKYMKLFNFTTADIQCCKVALCLETSS